MSSQEPGPPIATSRLSGRLWVAVRRFDDELAFSVLNRAFAVLSPGQVADLVVAPVLRRLGESWQAGPRMIAVEHFTSQVVRARFRAHSATTTPPRRVAVCFTPSGDQHDLGVHLAAAVLVDAGWRTHVLGPDTPSASVAAVIDELAPALVVVGASVRAAALAFLESDVVTRCPVIAGGCGFEAGDGAASPGFVVHEGAFADVAQVAQRLLDRMAAPGAAGR